MNGFITSRLTGLTLLLLAGLGGAILIPSLMSGRTSGPGHYLDHPLKPEHYTALIATYEEKLARERQEYDTLLWAWLGAGVLLGLGLAITGHSFLKAPPLHASQIDRSSDGAE